MSKVVFWGENIQRFLLKSEVDKRALKFEATFIIYIIP